MIGNSHVHVCHLLLLQESKKSEEGEEGRRREEEGRAGQARWSGPRGKMKW